MANPNNTEVYLSVDTAAITESNKDEKVTFSDNQTDPADPDPPETPGSPSTYVSSVHRGAQISWSASAQNGSTTVSVTAVTKKGDSPADILQSIGNPNDGVVTARVKGSPPNPPTAEETYSVSFSFTGTDGKPKSFTVDPRLKMK